MATPAHLIIDGRPQGLPHAAGYYRQFPLEPSPLGDLTVAAGRTTVMQATSSLEGAIDAMIVAGSGATVILICHAFQDGLLLPVTAGATRALSVVGTMDTIDKLIGFETEAAAIRRLPNKTPDEQKVVIDRWTKLLDTIQPRAIIGTFTSAQAEAFYAKFLDRNAANLEFTGRPPRAGLQRFLAKVLRLRALKPARLELRSCNIGQDRTTMESVRKFFGADKLTAPTTKTFYLSPTPVSTMRQNGQAPPRRRGVAAPAARTPGVRGVLTLDAGAGSTFVVTQEGHTTRGFFPVITARTRLTGGPRSGLHLDLIVTSLPTFTLTIDGVTAFTFRSSASVISTSDGVTQDWSRVRTFVNGWVMPNSTYQSGPVPLVGFITPDTVDQPFVLPNETSYMRLIEQVP